MMGRIVSAVFFVLSLLLAACSLDAQTSEIKQSVETEPVGRVADAAAEVPADGSAEGVAPEPAEREALAAGGGEETEEALGVADHTTESAGADSNSSTETGGPRDGQEVALTYDRKIIYSTSLKVRVEDARKSAQSLQDLAIRFGGYVSNTRIEEVDDENGTYGGLIQVRIPADQFYKVLDELRARFEVVTEQLETQDVTEQYVDLQARIENLERTETEVQALLTEARERGASTDELMRIYRQITELREQIERLQGRINVLQDAVVLATINIEMIPSNTANKIVKDEVEEEWNPSAIARQAFDDLTSVLQSISTLVIYFVIAILPLILLILLPVVAITTLYRWYQAPRAGNLESGD